MMRIEKNLIKEFIGLWAFLLAFSIAGLWLYLMVEGYIVWSFIVLIIMLHYIVYLMYISERNNA